MDTTSQPTPKPKRSLRKLLKIVSLVLLLVVYTVGVSLGSIWWRDKSVQDAHNAIDPRRVVQDLLVKFLDLKTVKRHITYRDNADRGMLVDWDLTSDFSNPRSAKTTGFLTLTWLRDKTEYKQKLEMVLMKGGSYEGTGYFRVVDGADLTGAPKDWFKAYYQSLSFGPYSSSGKLYDRHGSYSNGTQSFGSIFSNTPYKDQMKNFSGFDFEKFNSAEFYIIAGNMREGNDKTSLAEMIRANRPYAMQNCDKDQTTAWCSGQSNSSEMQAVSGKYYESEGFGGNSLTFGPIQYWMIADLKTGWLTKFQIDEYGSDSFVTEFSAHNEPVEIKAPI